MKNCLLTLKTLCLTLACVLGLGSAMAQTLTPENGKQYRIKNVRNKMYLTMDEESTTALSMSGLKKSVYQFWELVETTEQHSDGSVTYNIQNTGWKKNGTDAYLGSGSVGTNANITVSTKPGANSNYAFVPGDKNYSIVVCNTKFGINSEPAGTLIVLYDAKDAGSFWVLEEAEIPQPQVVTMKSARSGKYMTESNDGKVVQNATLTDMGKWIKYDFDGGTMFINHQTHNIIQAPGKNAAVVTGSRYVGFSTLTDGTNFAFCVGDICLNERNGNDVCGWNDGLNDAGNKWVVNQVAEISDEEVTKILKEKSAFASQIEDGVYYRLYNETRGNYAYERYQDGAVRGAALDEQNYTQVWQAIKSGSGYRLQNAVSGKEITSGSGPSSPASTQATGTSYTVKVNTSVSNDLLTYFNFSSGGFALHMDSGATLVNWYAGSGSVGASEWQLCKVDLDEDLLAAQRAEYQSFANVEENFNTLNKNKSAYQKILDTLFEDKACSTLKLEAMSMSDEEFTEAVKELPDVLREMCLKIRNDSWTISKGGNNWEKYFRIADYKVYSKSDAIWQEVGMSNAFSRLSNPTGISGDEGDIIAIMVDESCPTNATLKLELTDGGEKDNPRTGQQIALSRGLNLVLLKKNQDIFVFYEVSNTGNSRSYYLDRFKDMKIHIEGGKLNGYYDQTRNMTDADWADMVSSDMLKHGRVFLKGSHAVGNWPSSILLKNNPKTIDDICTFYNNIPVWEQEIMGVNNTYLPNIEQRYRNVYTALGTELGDAYMYSTTYGTFYNWGTLNDILSKNVLSNGGNQWGPAHEFGHNHQALFNMVGCTEVSNNVFSNAVIYKMGAAMSRGVALSELIPNYAKRRNWIELGIWCKTQMYWKLYQYFHLAGYDTEFFPKVFSIMRKNGLQHQNGQLVPASTDYLRFAEVCCEAAQADLSEFFQMYGFFEPIVYDTKKDGIDCKHIDDYSQYYLYVTDAMINNTKKKMEKYEKKILNIGFIDDRIRKTPATYPGAPKGAVRTAMNGGGDNSVGTEGTIGMYLDYYPENYVPCTQYEATVRNNKTAGTISVSIKKTSGAGAMGFKVYSPSGELMYFYNDYSFTIPNLHSIYGDYDNTNIVIMAADAQGNDVQVYNPSDPNMTAISDVTAAARPNVIYDLQGRRTTRADKPGIYVVNGKKVVIK